MRIRFRLGAFEPVLSGLLLVAPLPALGVSIDWVTVGDAGNACDTQIEGCFGSVAEVYRIAKYEVTNAQYAEFLNAVAATDTNALYSSAMGGALGGITRTGSAGSYVYALKAGFENQPVIGVSWYDALRFANWLHNGQPIGLQGPGTTETGAYTMTGQYSTTGRTAAATVFLPTENEWYKAAYYDPVSASFFDYPTGTNTQTACVAPAGDTGNSANCGSAVGTLTDVGAYLLSSSPNGTYDQGGNVYEWNETAVNTGAGLRGGAWDHEASTLGTANRAGTYRYYESSWIGFRVASVVPEPGTGVLVLAGLLGIAGRRRLGEGWPTRRSISAG